MSKRATKQCSKCPKELPLNKFHKNKKGKYGVGSRCKKCTSVYNQKRYKKYNGLEKSKKCGLKRKFNMTLEQYDQMFEQQNGVCAICGLKETRKNQWGTTRLSVDHNHKTGKVRGLLCGQCNTVLGLVYDSRETLLRAAIYLEEKDG